MQTFTWLTLVGGIASCLSVIISIDLIIKHLRHYTNKEFQRLIVRILLMVPIYAIDSWLSLRFHDYSIYFDLVRDCYEAYVLYIFFRLLVAYCGGEQRLAVVLTSEPPLEHPWPMCCLPRIQLGWGFLRAAKISILQFVLIKPLCTLISVALNPFGYFGDGEWRLDRAYVYLLIIDNFSITLSMYFLVLFYKATHADLEPYKPLGKFLCIKAVLFLSFWQSATISGLSFFNVLPEIEGINSMDLEYVYNDFLICCEMFLISIAHIFAFGYKDYVVDEDENENENAATAGDGTDAEAQQEKKNSLCTNFSDVITQRDVIVDTRETLALRPKLVRRFTSFFDQPNPSVFLMVGCYVDCRSNYHASFKDFDTKFACVLSNPPGMIICKSNPFRLAVDLRSRFTKPSTSSSGSIEQPRTASTTAESDAKAILDSATDEETEWVVASDDGVAAGHTEIASSPYDLTDMDKALPCDLIECWISAKKLPMMTYRPSKSARNPQTAIDILTIHLKKNFHIVPYIFQLRGTGEELLSLAESINIVRSLVMRDMNLLSEFE